MLKKFDWASISVVVVFICIATFFSLGISTYEIPAPTPTIIQEIEPCCGFVMALQSITQGSEFTPGSVGVRLEPSMHGPPDLIFDEVETTYPTLTNDGLVSFKDSNGYMYELDRQTGQAQ